MVINQQDQITYGLNTLTKGLKNPNIYSTFEHLLQHRSNSYFIIQIQLLMSYLTLLNSMKLEHHEDLKLLQEI